MLVSMYSLFVVNQLRPTNMCLGEIMLTLTKKLSRMLGLGVAAVMTFATSSATANVVTSTSGLTTTYTENFNGGTSFSGGWFNAPLTTDDYLWLTVLDPTSSFTFSSSRPLSELTLGFWYSVPGDNNGQVQFANSGIISLSDVPGSALQFLLNNPGSSTGGIGGGFDQAFAGHLYNLGAGMYTITLSTAGHLLDGLKVDDLTITTTAVPEPGSLAIMGIGLLGLHAMRRRAKGKQKGHQALA
jgi:hypothetical protein